MGKGLGAVGRLELGEGLKNRGGHIVWPEVTLDCPHVHAHLSLAPTIIIQTDGGAVWPRIHGRFISGCQPDSKFTVACVQASLPHDSWPQFPPCHTGLPEPSRQVEQGYAEEPASRFCFPGSPDSAPATDVESSAFLARSLCHQEQGTPWTQEVTWKWQPQSSP